MTKKRRCFWKILELQNPDLEKLIKASYKLLGLISYITSRRDGNPKHGRLQKEPKAPQAAGKIHTDFERGFIRAEVVSL